MMQSRKQQELRNNQYKPINMNSDCQQMFSPENVVNEKTIQMWPNSVVNNS